MNKTSIAWTDYTSNPLRAENPANGHDGHYCEKVGPGCANCYASAQNARGAYPRSSTGIAYPANPPLRGPQGERLSKVPAERGMLRHYLNEAELREWQKPKYAGKRCFAFDMTDLFGEWVPDETLDKVFAAMALASGLTFQILTKRPERMREYFRRQWGVGLSLDTFVENVSFVASLAPDGPVDFFRFPIPNVWLGVTCENQYWADRRIPVLLDTPAAVRFVSYEPALEPVDLGPFLMRVCRNCGGEDDVHLKRTCTREDLYSRVEWVIVGGESGANARPFDPDWAADVLDQCREEHVAFFMKQLGGKRFPDDRLESLPEDLRVREFPR